MEAKRLFVLLIQKRDEAGLIRQSLAGSGDGRFQVQCVESMPAALARIGGGGVDVIMLDLALHDDRSRETLAGYLPLHQAAPGVPIIVMYDAHDEGLALRAMRVGAADYLQKEESSDGMIRSVCSALEFVRKQLGSRDGGLEL